MLVILSRVDFFSLFWPFFPNWRSWYNRPSFYGTRKPGLGLLVLAHFCARRPSICVFPIAASQPFPLIFGRSFGLYSAFVPTTGVWCRRLFLTFLLFSDDYPWKSALSWDRVLVSTIRPRPFLVLPWGLPHSLAY